MALPRTGWQLADGSVLDFMEISDGYLAKRVGRTVVGVTFSGPPSVATTVSNETTFGISPAVGTDAQYARQDHTHGTPAAPTAASVGADAAGTASAAVSAHVAAPDPHPQYALESALGALATLSTVGTAQIDNDSVSFAKMQNMVADTLLGRGNGGGTGDPQQISLGTNLSMTGTTLNAAGGAGTPAVSVVTETAFGQADAVGVSTNYARQDHTHGTMAAPTTVSGNAGTATALQTARAINGVNFDGTAPITVTASGATLTGTVLAAALIGTAGTQACAGNDARLSDARTPTTHATSHQPGGSDAMAVDAVAATGSLRTLGTGAAQACGGTDARLTDSRTPLAHATSHKSGGSDAVKLDELAAPTDVTTLNASTSAHGLLRKLPGGTTTVLLGDGTFGSPPAGPAGDFSRTYSANSTVVAATCRILAGPVKVNDTVVLKIEDNATLRVA